jgi:hypothetical protein
MAGTANIQHTHGGVLFQSIEAHGNGILNGAMLLEFRILDHVVLKCGLVDQNVSSFCSLDDILALFCVPTEHKPPP